MNKFERGSEWRKWDLHVHTPETKLNDQYSVDNNQNKWDLFCKTIEESDVSVFGITDYFSVGNYFAFVEKFKTKYPNSNKVFFPNIEFRIDSTNNKKEHIQFHVIFSNQEKTTNKIDDFFIRLQLVSTDNKDLTNKYCTENDLSGVTYDKAMVKIDELEDKLQDDFTNDEYLIVGVTNGYGSLRPNKATDGRGAEYAKEIDKKCKLFFGRSKNTDFFLNKEKGRSQYSLPRKPVVFGCDSHSFKTLNKKLGKSFEEKNKQDEITNYAEITWIKADPTFEGLKQILCEPEDRVKIQANKPEEKSGYYVIKSVDIDSNKSIDIDSKIIKQKILLNSNLNTIIGGRSTGKSTLLQLIARRINPNIDEINELVKKIPQDDVNIIWQDDEKNKGRDIEFFPQNHIHKIASDKKEKNKLIQGIVEYKDEYNFIKNYDKFCNDNKITLQDNIDNLFKLKTDIDALTSNLKEKGDKSGLETEIKNLQNRIQDLHKEEHYSEKELKQYESVRDEILELEQLQKTLEKDKNEISNLKEENLFNTSFNYKFNQLSEPNAKAIQEIFDSIKDKAVKQWKVDLTKKLTEIDDIIEKYQSDIKNKKESAIFNKGKTHLEKNNQYKELNDRLNIENEKLTKINSLQTQINSINRQKDELCSTAIKNHISYITQIDELVSKFSLAHDDIAIKIEKTYCKDKCKGLLQDFINLQSHNRQKFVNNWGDNYRDNIETTIESFLKKSLENKIELKSHKDIKDLAKGLLTENWYSMSYELTYQNDTFNKMSDGKKAFVVLKLLLEFNNKKCPILIDQPEDSLDNRSIYNELVTYLKQKKKDRQIILVTHNANIVVNTDAEEVIVANQHGENSKNQNDIKFQYISGSLENTSLKNATSDIVLNAQGIREHTCEILEGGTEAFKKRENKYSINWRC